MLMYISLVSVTSKGSYSPFFEVNIYALWINS
jgi:hypothetical protein